jgi:hypothetical protein
LAHSNEDAVAEYWPLTTWRIEAPLSVVVEACVISFVGHPHHD